MQPRQIGGRWIWAMDCLSVQQKSRFSGFSDTRSTPENAIKIPEPHIPACHQLWGHLNDLVHFSNQLVSFPAITGFKRRL
jgi:hypothetical protein